MTICLRDYQELAVNMVRAEIQKGHKKVLLVLPTASGKTFVLADIAKKTLDNGHKVIAWMHRRQLVDQMVNAFKSFGIDCAKIMSGVEPSLDCDCQIATMQTHLRRLKLSEIEANRWFINASVCMVDESHHILSKSYQSILKNYSDKIVIGVTATPCLSSGVGMGEYFDAIVQPVSIQKLVNEKHLVPGVYFGPDNPDVSKLKVVAGDYTKKGLGELMNKPKLVGSVVDNWLRIAGDKKTMVFCVNIAHSKALLDEFTAKGVTAEHLDSFSPDIEREETLSRFRSGETQVLLNIALYTEGTDIKEIEAICIARPTRSLGMHLQIIGRGARPNDRKDSFIIIDHGGNVARLGYYEDEIIWGLSGKESSIKKKPRKKEKKIRTCKECTTLFTGAVCPTCGLKIKEYKKLIEAEEAELIRIGDKKKPAPSMAEKRKFYGQLEYERKMKGYKSGWTYHKYLSKFKVAPHHSLKNTPPMQPDKAFFNFLTYQNLKYAKSKKKLDNTLAI